MLVLLLHTHSPPTPYTRNTKATVHFCLPKVPTAFLKKATFPPQGRTEKCKMGQISKPVPQGSSRLCSVQRYWWPQKTQTALKFFTNLNMKFFHAQPHLPRPCLWPQRSFVVVWAIFIPALGKHPSVLTLSCEKLQLTGSPQLSSHSLSLPLFPLTVFASTPVPQTFSSGEETFHFYFLARKVLCLQVCIQANDKLRKNKNLIYNHNYKLFWYLRDILNAS